MAEPVEGLSEDVDAIGWVTPNQETTGTHVNIAAAGVAAHAPNRENAIAFLEYLTTPGAQEFFANQNHEFPVTEGVEVGDIAALYGDFKRDDAEPQRARREPARGAGDLQRGRLPLGAGDRPGRAIDSRRGRRPSVGPSAIGGPLRRDTREELRTSMAFRSAPGWSAPSPRRAARR